MKYSLKTKLTMSYILVAFVCIFLLSICANIFLEKYFTDYVATNQEQKNQDIVATLSSQYSHNNGWNSDVVAIIGINALESGTIMKILDQTGNVIWDATTHNNGMCQGIVLQMAQNMNGITPFFKGEYTEVPYAIYSGTEVVGQAFIGVYGPYYLNDTDLAFIATLNKFIGIVAIISLIFSFILGTIMARKLSMPIIKVINSAQMISKGFYLDRISQKSTTKEMDQLTITINDMAQSLEKQDQLRKRLTSDVSHELRTPLATLQSHLEAMMDGIWEPNKERLASCHEEVTRINKMVGDLEQLTKFESDNLVLNTSNFDIASLIQRTVGNFETDFSLKNITVDVKVEPCTIRADRDKITQVLINLISNAIKFTLENGIIEIKTICLSETIRIIINDNGIGISKAEQPLVFERFYRTDQSRTRHTGGSGIGLTIVKSIVEAHHGKVELVSEEGKGSQFVVILPIN